MLNDIETKDDLVKLVNTFYDRVKADEVLGHIFNSIIGDDWSHHLPIMYSFWNSTLFGVEGYSGQAIGKHIEIDKKIRLQDEHFTQWLELWNSTVDSLFCGVNADTIKKKAAAILQLIRFKVEAGRSGKSLA